MGKNETNAVPTWEAAKYYLNKHFAAGRFVWTIALGWFFGTIFNRMVPALFIAKILTNVGNGETSWDANASSFLLGAGSVLFGEFLIRSGLYYQSIIANRVANNILVEGHALLLKKSLAFHADRFAGDLTSKVIKLSERSVLFIDSLYMEIATFLAMFLFAVITLGTTNVVAIVLYILALVTYSLLAAPLVTRRVKLIEKRSRMKSQQTGLLVDSLTNIAAIKSFARDKEENDHFKNHVEATGRAELHSWLYSLFKVDPLTIIFYSS